MLKLLDILEKSDDNLFDDFCEALINSRQQRIVDVYLKPNIEGLERIARSSVYDDTALVVAAGGIGTTAQHNTPLPVVEVTDNNIGPSGENWKQ